MAGRSHLRQLPQSRALVHDDSENLFDVTRATAALKRRGGLRGGRWGSPTTTKESDPCDDTPHARGFCGEGCGSSPRDVAEAHPAAARARAVAAPGPRVRPVRPGWPERRAAPARPAAPARRAAPAQRVAPA